MTAGDIRPDLTEKLRAPSDGPVACKVCGETTVPLGIVDFNRSCEDARGVLLPRTRVPVQYRQCQQCALAFTETFDDWTQADFEAHIYNADYEIVDPDYVAKRPETMAGSLIRALDTAKGELDMLDYGGGNGRFAELMTEAGFLCQTYDPFTPAFSARPERTFNFVTCFETLEHMPDPVAGVGDIAALTGPDGAVLFGTLVQPADFATIGLGWWYVGPRNGHVTLYSRQALARLWGRFGFTMGSFSDNAHIAFRGADPPAVVRQLTGKR